MKNTPTMWGGWGGKKKMVDQKKRGPKHVGVKGGGKGPEPMASPKKLRGTQGWGGGGSPNKKNLENVLKRGG